MTLVPTGIWPVSLVIFASCPAAAWNDDSQSNVNQIELSSLPTSSPAFVTTSVARERTAFLSDEPGQ